MWRENGCCSDIGDKKVHVEFISTASQLLLACSNGLEETRHVCARNQAKITCDIISIVLK